MKGTVTGGPSRSAGAALLGNRFSQALGVPAVLAVRAMVAHSALGCRAASGCSEVQQVHRLCNHYGVAMIPFGAGSSRGRTGRATTERSPAIDAQDEPGSGDRCPEHDRENKAGSPGCNWMQPCGTAASSFGGPSCRCDARRHGRDPEHRAPIPMPSTARHARKHVGTGGGAGQRRRSPAADTTAKAIAADLLHLFVGSRGHAQHHHGTDRSPLYPRPEQVASGFQLP